MYGMRSICFCLWHDREKVRNLMNALPKSSCFFSFARYAVYRFDGATFCQRKTTTNTIRPKCSLSQIYILYILMIYEPFKDLHTKWIRCLSFVLFLFIYVLFMCGNNNKSIKFAFLFWCLNNENSHCLERRAGRTTWKKKRSEKTVVDSQIEAKYKKKLLHMRKCVHLVHAFVCIINHQIYMIYTLAVKWLMGGRCNWTI